MFDERAFIARVEAAGPDEFARILSRPGPEEERALRAHLGEDRYQRLHAMAMRRGVRSTRRVSAGNVVVIHGIMGGELSTRAANAASGDGDHVWARLLALVRGRVSRLRLAEDGRSDFDAALTVEASGIMKRAYGEILLALADRWSVKAFWFDWRKDLTLAGNELAAKITSWFGAEPDQPVHIVAHSMGGLVARTFIMDHPAQWERMRGRLVMLGTPNYGSYAIPQVITGLEGMVRKLALVDLSHDVGDLLPVFNSFAGSYQMLPSPQRMAELKVDGDWMYDAASYAPVAVPQRHLDAARTHHAKLHEHHAGLDDAARARLLYVAGYNQPTFDGVAKGRAGERAAYTVTYRGDGRVPHDLGRLDGARTWYVEEGHGDLPCNEAVLGAVDDLLARGTTEALPEKLPASARVRGAPANPEAVRDRMWADQDAELEQLAALAQRAQSRGADPAAAHQVAPVEREVEERLVEGFLATPGAARRRAPPVAAAAAASARATLTLRLAHGDIDKTDALPAAELPVDAIAVGHYFGVRPQNAEAALDAAISQALHKTAGGPPGRVDERERVLVQYADRGIIRGELAQPFFLNDPRPAPDGVQRTIAIAGMGTPGRFGEPELTVLARELCWSLGRLGKRHLATVLIGAGSGNLPVPTAVSGWLRGVQQALDASREPEGGRIRQITFVERDARRLRHMRDAMRECVAVDAGRLTIEYEGPSEEEIVKLEREGARRAMEEWLTRQSSGGRHFDPSSDAATRITVSLDRETYRFGAITADAAIPEREIPLDPSLVLRANDEMAAEQELERQREHGRFLGRLLVPEELQPQLASTAPIVLMLDATTARVHWEMIAYSASAAGVPDQPSSEFLGLARGFTRQLRTTFAPPPEPPPPPQRVLRVLLVADPAADAHLPGAEEEAVEVAELLESFNAVYGATSESRIEVVRLFGPTEATRTRVMRELILRRYDVLHFAGHCLYDAEHPAASGWLFTGGELLRARELQRIDRIPKFVFSNACESGVTPARPERRSAGMAPSFAEAFFARGVANFVCTAWPIDDTAARVFAATLYGSLVGVKPAAADGSTRYERGRVCQMWEAMQRARRAIAEQSYGGGTWGAYQHYGNPYFQLFDHEALEQKPRAAREDAAEGDEPTADDGRRPHGRHRRPSSPGTFTLPSPPEGSPVGGGQ